MRFLSHTFKTAACAAAMLLATPALTPQAEAGGCGRGGVSLSVGFPIGNHGYVSVGSYRSISYGRSYHRSSYRHGYGGYGGYSYYQPVYYRPISRVCYDDDYSSFYPYYRGRSVIYDTPGVHHYGVIGSSQRDDTRVYEYQADAPTRTLVAESSLPAAGNSSVDVSDAYGSDTDTVARPTYAQQRATARATRRVTPSPSATDSANVDDAFAMLERGDDAEAQRAFASLIARSPRNPRGLNPSHAVIGYALSSAALGQVDRAERAFAQATADNPNVWDQLAQYPATRSVSLALLRDGRFAESAVMRAPLDRMSVAAAADDLTMPDFETVASQR